MSIEAHQLSSKVVSTSVLPTASGQVPLWNGYQYSLYPETTNATKLRGCSISFSPPTISGQSLVWNSGQNLYEPQIPCTRDFFGRPLRNSFPTTSGISLQWSGSDWFPRYLGETLIFEKEMTAAQVVSGYVNWTNITELVATVTIYGNEAINIYVTLICVQGGAACEPAAALKIDGGTPVFSSVVTEYAGWWLDLHLNKTIQGLSPGNHTIQICFISDSTTTICGGTTSYYSEYPTSIMQITRVTSEI